MRGVCMHFLHIYVKDMMYFYIHVYTGSGNTYNVYLYTCVYREQQHMYDVLILVV